MWDASREEIFNSLGRHDVHYNTVDFGYNPDKNKLFSRLCVDLVNQPPSSDKLKDVSDEETKRYIEALVFFAFAGESQYQFAYENIDEPAALIAFLDSIHKNHARFLYTKDVLDVAQKCLDELTIHPDIFSTDDHQVLRDYIAYLRIESLRPTTVFTDWL